MARGQLLRTNQAAGTQLAACAGAVEGKRALHPGRVRPSLWLPGPLAAEGKGTPLPGRVQPSLWLPGPLAAEGKGAPLPGRVCPSPWLPEPLRLGKAQNTGTTESALLWSTRKLEPHSAQGPLHIEQPGT